MTLVVSDAYVKTEVIEQMLRNVIEVWRPLGVAIRIRLRSHKMLGVKRNLALYHRSAQAGESNLFA